MSCSLHPSAAPHTMTRKRMMSSEILKNPRKSRRSSRMHMSFAQLHMRLDDDMHVRMQLNKLTQRRGHRGGGAKQPSGRFACVHVGCLGARIADSGGQQSLAQEHGLPGDTCSCVGSFLHTSPLTHATTFVFVCNMNRSRRLRKVPCETSCDILKTP
jgi:hypothetical protein